MLAGIPSCFWMHPRSPLMGGMGAQNLGHSPMLRGAFWKHPKGTREHPKSSGAIGRAYKLRGARPAMRANTSIKRQIIRPLLKKVGTGNRAIALPWEAYSLFCSKTPWSGLLVMCVGLAYIWAHLGPKQNGPTDLAPRHLTIFLVGMQKDEHKKLHASTSTN